MLTKQAKNTIIKENAAHDTDTGSVVVQIMLLTKEIKALTEHLKKHIHDHHSRRGLLIMVGKRRRFLQFLKREDIKAFEKISKKIEE